MTAPPPLAAIRVLEFAGLAPGPFAGLLLADYGASVLRLDRAIPKSGHIDPASPPPSTPDSLVRHKASIAVDVKSPQGIALIKALLPSIDVVIDPFRPGVLEKLGLHPTEVMQRINPRLITARVTGYRREGKYSAMAGHDINYIAVSGVLSMLGRKHEKPYPPANIIGDFAGGGATCFMGILLALLARERTGRGQVVEANMVDGAAYLASMPRLAMKARHGGPTWSGHRGSNLLDGGSPFYDTYETKDDGSGERKYMSVGALEPQFFAELLKGLGLKESDLPGGSRSDPRNWPEMAKLFARIFKSKTRAQWEDVFDGTDACVAPILTQRELEEERGFDQRPIVTLKETPSYAIAKGDASARPAVEGQGSGVEGEGWTPHGIGPGVGGEAVLNKWMGWQRGSQYEVENGGLVLRAQIPGAKL